jgi:hypothetical protein
MSRLSLVSFSSENKNWVLSRILLKLVSFSVEYTNAGNGNLSVIIVAHNDAQYFVAVCLFTSQLYSGLNLNAMTVCT